MDLSDTLTLEEVAQRLVPRAFGAWRVLSDILSGDCAMSGRYIANQDRRERAKRRAWRRRLVDQFGLDGRLLPRIKPGEKKELLGLFRTSLLEATDLKIRRKLVIEEARHLANAEIRELSRARLKRARDRLGHKVLAAVSTALRATDSAVSGIEDRPTLIKSAHIERAAIAAEHLVHAQIDILSGSLREGGRQWRDVVVHLTQLPAACGAQVVSGQTAASEATDQDIVAWMLDKQKELRGKAERNGRDVLVSLAMEHFGLKQAVVRRSWDGRPGAPKRK
jgi:hypothetical protein